MIELSIEQRIELASLRNHPGFKAMRQATELLFQESNGELLGMSRAKGHTAEQILSAQDQTRAFFKAYEKLFDVIDRCAKEREEADQGGEEPEEEPEKEFVLDQDEREQARQRDG